jgi:hypothetical protein
VSEILEKLPDPQTVHRQIGRLHRHLALLRRLLRLSQAAAAERIGERAKAVEQVAAKHKVAERREGVTRDKK